MLKIVTEKFSSIHSPAAGMMKAHRGIIHAQALFIAFDITKEYSEFEVLCLLPCVWDVLAFLFLGPPFDSAC